MNPTLFTEGGINSSGRRASQQRPHHASHAILLRLSTRPSMIDNRFLRTGFSSVRVASPARVTPWR
jgi:hypothetical protein